MSYDVKILKEKLKAIEAVLKKNKKLPKESVANGSKVGSSSEGNDGTLNNHTNNGDNSTKSSKSMRASARCANIMKNGYEEFDTNDAFLNNIIYNEVLIAPGRPSLQSFRLNIPEQPNTLSAYSLCYCIVTFY